jgi:hypothetical protein
MPQQVMTAASDNNKQLSFALGHASWQVQERF